MICCASNVNITICLIVCVTVIKNIPVNSHAFHSEENPKAKAPEVLNSEDNSQLVFSGKKTPEKQAERACSSEMFLSQTASCHIT
jgi:hypothetical protein